jgi:general secretion pathway protein K
VLVLWSVGILALLGVSLTSTARVQLRLATAARDRAVAEAAADGAIAQAVFVLLGGGQLGSAGQPARFRIGEAAVDIEADDEADKINPNAVRPEVLRGLLVAVGVDQPRAARLAGEIADWRIRGQVSVLGGLKADQYRERGLPYGWGGRPFESVDEIGLVPDMTPEIMARIRPWLSVYHEGEVTDTGRDSPVGSTLSDLRVSSRGDTGPVPISHNVVMRLTAVAVVRGRSQFARSAVVRIRAEPASGGSLFQVLTWE